MSTPPPQPPRPPRPRLQRTPTVKYFAAAPRPPAFAHKVYPDGADVAVRESIICEAEQQARLANSRVTDQHQLKKVVTDTSRKSS